MYMQTTSSCLGHEDFHLLQSDVSIIDAWLQQNYLTLNSGKCKCMVISRKRRPTGPGTLYLWDVPLEQVHCFKYLGVILSSDLSFSQHIDSTCSKARKILGLLYRRFYNNVNNGTLLQLYLSLVRPHLECASPVWNPHKHAKAH